MNWRCKKCGTVVPERSVQPTLLPALRMGKCWRCKAKRQFEPVVLGVTPLGTKAAEELPPQQRLELAEGAESITPSGAVARATDPNTSWQAAQSIAPEDLRDSQVQVLEILRKHGPLTDEAIYRYVNGEQSVSGTRTRRSELVDAGLVRDSGARATTAAGRNTIVWEAVERG